MNPPSPVDAEPVPLPDPLPVSTVDSHCHLDAIGIDVPQVLQWARETGVTRLVTVGDTVASSRWCAETAGRYGGVLAAVAVHPNESGGLTEEDYAELDRLAALPQVAAVGETGLDYYWGRVPPARQQEAFRRHIALSKRHSKALVIHDRDAHDDVLRILADEGAPAATVFHCFSGDEELARRCVAAGYLLSFSGTVTFRNAAALRAAALVVPEQQLLVETDAPFLAPHPHRGRRNAPHAVAYTLRVLAEVRGVPVDRLAATVADTAERAFGTGW